MSQIYLVSDGAVLKVLKLFEPDQHKRAEREFQTGSRLEHPHLGRVVGWLELSGCPGVLMDYVPGVGLMRWRQRSQVGLLDFLATTHGVIAALGYLHDQGLIHRDVKPDNILVDETRHARLIDFDLAVEQRAQRRTRGYSGTFFYLSPEQTYGDVLEITSDLYSLGVILYWGVTGQLPFAGSPEEMLAAHRTVVPTPPSYFSGRLEPFDPFFARLLAKDPRERHQRAEEVLEHLRDIESRLGV